MLSFSIGNQSSGHGCAHGQAEECLTGSIPIEHAALPLSVLSPASLQEQNEGARRPLLAPAKQDSENIANVSHKDTSNSCPLSANLQIASSVRYDLLRNNKKLVLLWEK